MDPSTLKSTWRAPSVYANFPRQTMPPHEPSTRDRRSAFDT